MRRFIVSVFIFILVILLVVTSTLSVVFYIQQNNAQNQISQMQTEIQVANERISELQNELDAEKAKNSSSTSAQSSSSSSASQCTSRSTNGRIVVTNPCDGRAATLPLKVSGSANVFEATVAIDIYDDKGKLIFRDFVMTNASDIGRFGDFEKQLSWNPPTDLESATIVFSESAGPDGDSGTKVQVDIRLP